MNKTILLAVDAASHVAAAEEFTRELSRDSGDKVVVLHVHEFAVGRFGRIRVDCAEGEGEQLAAGITAALAKAGVSAETEIQEANYGHVPRMILAVADSCDARIIVVGSRGRADLPHLPLGSVSHRLLHLARRPVLIVPKLAAEETAAEPTTAGLAAASEAATA
jgi:nucleotide-binding universal stress UspA family protein